MRLNCQTNLCPHKPVHASTHIRTWSGLWGHQYLVHFHCRIFHFFIFYFLFLRVNKKHRNANKWISYFFPLRCFLNAFFIFVCLFAFCAFAWLCFCAFSAFCTFGAFLYFWCVQNVFVKKNIKKFKTTLITSFILLLNLSFCKHEFFNHYNLLQLSQSFLIITIFFNNNNCFQL